MRFVRLRVKDQLCACLTHASIAFQWSKENGPRLVGAARERANPDALFSKHDAFERGASPGWIDETADEQAAGRFEVQHDVIRIASFD